MTSTSIDHLHQQIKNRLPPVLEEIAEIAGVEVALNLALQGGGRRLRVPREASGSRLASWVGSDAAARIVQHMSYMYFEIPQAKSACALWMRHEGKSIEDIAYSLKSTRRSVQNWLNGA